MAFEKIPSQRVLEVKVEKSLDLLAKRWDESVFIKLYASMRTSGLLARLSDSNFRTLVALATFMNAEGQCYPSQNALAVALGVTQPAVAKRLKRPGRFPLAGPAPGHYPQGQAEGRKVREHRLHGPSRDGLGHIQ